MEHDRLSNLTNFVVKAAQISAEADKVRHIIYNVTTE